MDSYETAQERWFRASGETLMVNQIRGICAAEFAAFYGCKQCNGTDKTVETQRLGTESYITAESSCTAVHVELVNPHDGETVFADPAECEWRCDWHTSIDNMTQCVAGAVHRHKSCGWQIRMDALFGEGSDESA